MNGLPSNIDLSFLKGRMILQICIGLHDLILNMDRNVAISIESSLECGTKDGIEQQINFPGDMDQLTKLLQVPLINSKRDNNGGLLLFFENESYLHIYNDSDMYESFVIKYKDTTIVA